MRVRGKTWSFSIGHDEEHDCWMVRLNWGGMATERDVNGLFAWKHTWLFGVRWPWRYLRRGILNLPHFYWHAH